MFTTLWASRTERAIAHVLCPVPDDLDHAALILTHTARDRARGAADLRSLEEWAGPERFDRIVQRCRDWGAGTAADLALGLPVAPSAYPDDALWAMEDREVDRLGRWLARWRAADSWPGRVGLVRSTIGINRDHLRMQLGHEPSPAEIRAAHRERLAEMARNALARVKPGTRGGATP